MSTLDRKPMPNHSLSPPAAARQSINCISFGKPSCSFLLINYLQDALEVQIEETVVFYSECDSVFRLR